MEEFFAAFFAGDRAAVVNAVAVVLGVACAGFAGYIAQTGRLSLARAQLLTAERALGDVDGSLRDLRLALHRQADTRRPSAPEG